MGACQKDVSEGQKKNAEKLLAPDGGGGLGELIIRRMSKNPLRETLEELESENVFKVRRGGLSER